MKLLLPRSLVQMVILLSIVQDVYNYRPDHRLQIKQLYFNWLIVEDYSGKRDGLLLYAS